MRGAFTAAGRAGGGGGRPCSLACAQAAAGGELDPESKELKNRFFGVNLKDTAKDAKWYKTLRCCLACAHCLVPSNGLSVRSHETPRDDDLGEAPAAAC